MAKDRVYEFSAPGRVEISGNHTDHQHGRVLAAAIDLTTNASVCKNDDEVTHRVLEACEVMGLTLLDHLIVSEENYYSYREETDYLV